MSGPNSSFLPVGLWLFASALVVLVLLIAFGFHFYQRRRFLAGADDLADVADLASRKEALQSDVAVLKEWITEQRDNLLRLTAEREEQEALRADLTRTRQSLTEARETRRGLTEQAEELERQRQSLNRTLEELRWRIGDLESKKGEAAALDRQLEKLRGQAAAMAKETDELRGQSLALEKRIEKYHQETVPLKEEAAKAAALEARQTSLLTELHFLDTEIAGREETLTNLKREAAALEESLAETRRTNEALVLTKTLEELRREAEEARTEVDALRTESLALEKRIEKYHREAVPLKEEAAKAAALEARQTSLLSELHFLDTKIAGREETLTNLKREAAALEESLAETRRTNEALILTKTLEELRREAEEARATASKLPELKMEQAALAARNEYLEAQIANHNLELTPLKQSVSKLQTWLEQIQPKAAAESAKLSILREQVAGLEARRAQLQLDEERLQQALENLGT